MHMIQMLWVLSFVLFTALFLMCFFRERLNSPIVNPLFIVVYTAWNNDCSMRLFD